MIKEIVKNQSTYKNTFGISAKCHYLYVKLLKIRMMKKLFLLSVVGALGALNASAQVSPGKSVMFGNTSNAKLEFHKQEGGIIPGLPEKSKYTTAKTTAGGSRWYSYSEFCSFLDVDFVNNGSLPYLWNKGDAMAIYGAAGGGVEADTIRYASYGISYDPAFSTASGFNEPTIYPGSSIQVTRANPYTVDSVVVFGVYGRNNMRTSTTDTLRIVTVYGAAPTSDMPVYYFNGPDMKANFGSDTVRFAAIKHDTVRNIAAGTTRVVRDYLLTTASLADTIPGGFNAFKVPVNLLVPAGNVVGITATFITGDTYTPYVDTIFYGSERPSNPFGRGLFRPSVFEQKPAASGGSGFPTYNPGYYNVGFVKFLPESPSWSGLYVPSYAYTAPFTLEIPNIDVKISCSSCKTLDEVSIKENKIIANSKAFPNPANTQLNVPVSVSETANVTVSISNMLGQVVATQNLGSMNAGQNQTAVFNTTSLSAGVYLYTVEANGQRVSNRFSVSH